ncbi:MAG: TIGR01244 family sulfur transferase [Azospirillaceae bacterium]
MATLTALEDGFYVGPQLTESDFDDLAAKGIKTVINNRPDGEEAGQLSAERAAELAGEHGIAYHYIPMTSESLTPEVIETFRNAVDESERPILAHCRSGTRSCVLWSITQAGAGERSVDEIVRCAADGGYDMSSVRPVLEAFAGRR